MPQLLKLSGDLLPMASAVPPKAPLTPSKHTQNQTPQTGHLRSQTGPAVCLSGNERHREADLPLSENGRPDLELFSAETQGGHTRSETVPSWSPPHEVQGETKNPASSLSGIETKPALPLFPVETEFKPPLKQGIGFFAGSEGFSIYHCYVLAQCTVVFYKNFPYPSAAYEIETELLHKTNLTRIIREVGAPQNQKQDTELVVRSHFEIEVWVNGLRDDPSSYRLYRGDTKSTVIKELGGRYPDFEKLNEVPKGQTARTQTDITRQMTVLRNNVNDAADTISS
jgi:hypothetical protein